jgi:ketol-acid reductoisomerase
MYEGGIADMRYSISDTARYGDVTRGPRVVNAQSKETMKEILKEIQSGEFAREFTADVRAGMPRLKQLVEADQDHPLEQTGRKLRAMMPWLQDGKLVDRQKN